MKRRILNVEQDGKKRIELRRLLNEIMLQGGEKKYYFVKFLDKRSKLVCTIVSKGENNGTKIKKYMIYAKKIIVKEDEDNNTLENSINLLKEIGYLSVDDPPSNNRLPKNDHVIKDLDDNSLGQIIRFLRVIKKKVEKRDEDYLMKRYRDKREKKDKAADEYLKRWGRLRKFEKLQESYITEEQLRRVYAFFINKIPRRTQSDNYMWTLLPKDKDDLKRVIGNIARNFGKDVANNVKKEILTDDYDIRDVTLETMEKMRNQRGWNVLKRLEKTKGPGKRVIPGNRKRKKKSSGSNNNKNNISSKKARKECGRGVLTDPSNFTINEIKSQCKGRNFEKLKILMDGTDTKARKDAIRKFFADSVDQDLIDYGNFEELVNDDHYNTVATTANTQLKSEATIEREAEELAHLFDPVVKYIGENAIQKQNEIGGEKWEFYNEQGVNKKKLELLVRSVCEQQVNDGKIEIPPNYRYWTELIGRKNKKYLQLINTITGKIVSEIVRKERDVNKEIQGINGRIQPMIRHPDEKSYHQKRAFRSMYDGEIDPMKKVMYRIQYNEAYHEFIKVVENQILGHMMAEGKVPENDHILFKGDPDYEDTILKYRAIDPQSLKNVERGIREKFKDAYLQYMKGMRKAVDFQLRTVQRAVSFQPMENTEKTPVEIYQDFIRKLVHYICQGSLRNVCKTYTNNITARAKYNTRAGQYDIYIQRFLQNTPEINSFFRDAHIMMHLSFHVIYDQNANVAPHLKENRVHLKMSGIHRNDKSKIDRSTCGIQENGNPNVDDFANVGRSDEDAQYLYQRFIDSTKRNADFQFFTMEDGQWDKLSPTRTYKEIQIKMSFDPNMLLGDRRFQQLYVQPKEQLRNDSDAEMFMHRTWLTFRFDVYRHIIQHINFHPS